MCNIYLFKFGFARGRLALQTVTQQTVVHARLSVLFPNQRSQRLWDFGLVVVGSNTLTAAAFCLCWAPTRTDIFTRVWPQVWTTCFSSQYATDKASLPSTTTPFPTATDNRSRSPLSNYKKSKMRGDECQCNKCQSAAVLPASFSLPHKPMILCPEEILEKYKCKSSASVQFHLGESRAVS